MSSSSGASSGMKLSLAVAARWIDTLRRAIRPFDLRGECPQAFPGADRDGWLLLIEGATIGMAADTEMRAGTIPVVSADVPLADIACQHEDLFRLVEEPSLTPSHLSLLRAAAAATRIGCSRETPARGSFPDEYALGGHGALGYPSPSLLAFERLFLGCLPPRPARLHPWRRVNRALRTRSIPPSHPAMKINARRSRSVRYCRHTLKRASPAARRDRSKQILSPLMARPPLPLDRAHDSDNIRQR